MSEVGKELVARLDLMTLQPQVMMNVSHEGSDLNNLLQARYPKARMLDANQAAESVDLIIANLFLPWQSDFLAILSKWRRLLRPNGLLMFSVLGTDTLTAWTEIFTSENLPHYVDMHNLGDLLLQAGLADPVLDVNYYSLIYRDRNKLFAELIASGMLLPDVEYQQEDCLPSEDGKWHARYEIVYGHAFAPVLAETSTSDGDGVARIPLSQLRRQLNRT